MNKYHRKERISLQNILPTIPNDQRNMELLKEIFVEIGNSWKDENENISEKKYSIKCNNCHRKGHMAQDNAVIKPSCYSMPLIGKIFSTCGASKYFSVIDLQDAFHQLAVHPDAQHILAFCWKGNIVSKDVLLGSRPYTSFYTKIDGYYFSSTLCIQWLLY